MKSVLRQENGAEPTKTAPSVMTKSWTPPDGSWEDEIDRIHACEEESDGKLVVYLIWNNGKETRHETSVIYHKCPQKVNTLCAEEARMPRLLRANGG